MPVDPSDPMAAGAQMAVVSIQWFKRLPVLPAVTRLAYDAPGHRVTVDGAAWP